MFDNLRDQSSELPFDEGATGTEVDTGQAPIPPAAGGRPIRILGMTAPQRFIIAAMLMLAVCSLGAMCLLITGRIGL
jgi:hypothetical protein